MNRALLRVMLDPASYLHPSRLPVGSARAGAALNHYLIAHYRLPPPCWTVNEAEGRLLRAWPGLPRAAYLLGGVALRGALLQQWGYLRCDPDLRRFLTLPLSAPQVMPTRALDENLLLAQGASMLAPLIQPLAAAWQQRAALLFPAEAGRALCASAGPMTNPTLIQLALFHGKNS
jgi:type III secretion system OrgA/MxiK family protein